ncbi:MAG: cytochrome P450 [Anaerolineae bacterium]
MTTLAHAGAVNPLPPIDPLPTIGAFQLLRAFRSNLLGAFGADAYTELRVSFRRFGKRFVFLSDPEDIDHIFNAHIDRYRPNVLAERLLEPVTGRGILLLEGEEWDRFHRQLIPAFQPRHVESLVPSFHQTAIDHIESWAAGGNCTRDLLIDFRRLTLAVIARSMLSIHDEAKTAELADFASQAENAGALLRWQDYVALLIWRGMAQPAERKAIGARWRSWIQALIDSRPSIDDTHQARDMLDLLRAARDAEGRPAATEDIADHVGTMLSAGFATTALALFWTIVLLAHFPDQQEAIRRELCHGSAAAPPSTKELRSSRVAISFLYETLRLYPPAYVIAREARTEDQIGDFRIPRGSAVIVSPWLVHRHAALWSDPNRFNPDRFVRDGRIVTPKAWMPFGTGPRVCIGAAFATMEILTIIRALLGRYRVSLPGDPLSPVGRVMLHPEAQSLFKLTSL